MKKSKILIILFVVIVVLSFTKDAIIKFSVEQAVHAAIGVRVTIGSLRVGFLSKQVVDIKDFKVLNPPGYADRVMVEIPQIYVEYDFKTVFSNKLFIHDLQLYLKEFQVVKNEKGVSNVEGIKLPESKEKKDIAIGNLHLKIAKVGFKDYSQNPPLVKEYDVNLDEQFQNIENLNALVRVVLVRAMTTSAVKNFVNFDTAELQHSVEGIVSKGVVSGVNNAIQKATDSLKSLFGK